MGTQPVACESKQTLFSAVKIRASAGLRQFREYLRHPPHLPFLINITLISAMGCLIGALLTGVYRIAFSSRHERDAWMEFCTQVMQSAGTVAGLLLHPTRLVYLVRLIRWTPADIISLRKVLSRGPTTVAKPRERYHMAIVIGMLNFACISQYAIFLSLCLQPPSLMRIAITAPFVFGAFGVATLAGIYFVMSPLARLPADLGLTCDSDVADDRVAEWAALKSADAALGSTVQGNASKAPIPSSCSPTGVQVTDSNAEQSSSNSSSRDGSPTRSRLVNFLLPDGSDSDSDSCASSDSEVEAARQGQNPPACAALSAASCMPPLSERLGSARFQLSRTQRGAEVNKRALWQPTSEDPEAPTWSGSLCSACEDGPVAAQVALCCCLSFGWHLNRVGFGSAAFHVINLVFFLFGPPIIFTASSRFIQSPGLRGVAIAIGCVGSLMGLLYGGFWRWKLRRTFDLPASRWACGHKAASDFAAWLVCPCFALCQEIGTAKRHSLQMVPPDESRLALVVGSGRKGTKGRAGVEVAEGGVASHCKVCLGGDGSAASPVRVGASVSSGRTGHAQQDDAAGGVTVAPDVPCMKGGHTGETGC